MQRNPKLCQRIHAHGVHAYAHSVFQHCGAYDEVCHAEPEQGTSAPLEAREGYVPMQPLHVRLNLAALSEGQRPLTAPIVQETEPR